MSIVRAEGSLINTAPIVWFLCEEDGGEAHSSGSNQSIVDPDIANVGDQEDEEEADTNKIVETSQEASNYWLVHWISHLHSHFKEYWIARVGNTGGEYHRYVNLN